MEIQTEEKVIVDRLNDAMCEVAHTVSSGNVWDIFNESERKIAAGEYGNITVYKCDSCDEKSACGFDGETKDWCIEECSHTFTKEEARRFAACWNYCEGKSTDYLEDVVRETLA